MKSKFAFVATFTIAWLGTAIPQALANHCSIGQEAEVLWKGDWYPATVLDVNENLCYVTYEGYDSSWDEWVEPERFRASFQPGDSVRILWKGEWYPGQVLEISDDSFDTPAAFTGDSYLNVRTCFSRFSPTKVAVPTP